MLTRPRPRSRKASIVGVCILVGLLTATAVITAVAAQNTSARPTVDPRIARLPPDKQTAVAPRATKIAEYASAHPEVRNIPPTATYGPPIQGIQYKYGNPWNMHLIPTNEWFGSVNGRPISVFAGTYSTWDARGIVYDSAQGYVAVGVGNIVDNDHHVYLTPTKHGGLKITAVNGGTVSLVAEDGTLYTFDLDTRTFS